MQNLFNSKSRKELDDMIKARLGQGSLVTDMETDEKKKSAVTEGRLLQWSDEWKKYPYLYIFLAVSALFTMTLGMFMGIAPKVDLLKDVIIYHTDGMHLFLALVYMIAFPVVTEVAFTIGKWLYHTRENGNKTQTYTMIAMMVIAGISIVGTGIAGGMVVASNIAFLSAFIEIPAAAQKWVIVVIPVLLAVYAFLLTGYSLSSASAKSERMLFQMNHRSRLDHQTRQRGIQQIAEEELQVAELGLFLEMVQQGKMSSAQATAAIRAGRTLGQEELFQGKDIDGNGGIGNNSPAPVPYQAPRASAPAFYPIPAIQDQREEPRRPRPPITKREEPTYHPMMKMVPRSGAIYTLKELLDYMGLTKEKAVALIQQNGLTKSSEVFELLGMANYLPDDLKRGNFDELFAELMAPDLQSHPNNGVGYTLDQFMNFQREYQGRPDFSTDELADLLFMHSDPDSAWRAFKRGDGVPDDMTRQNFVDIYAQLMKGYVKPQPIKFGGNGNGSDLKA